MYKYSNVTKEQMQEILADFNATQKVSLPDHIKVQPFAPQKTTCKYAEDTGERAFVAAPCRGNKIICHKIDGHISYTKACCAEQCKFFETLDG